MSRTTKKQGSQTWIERHLNDPYVKQAQSAGLRSRAAYKLLELLDKYRFIEKGMVVIDLGSAPGSWSQVASQRVDEKGCVIAVDLLPMDAIPGVAFKQADFTESETMSWIKQQIPKDKKVNAVISDMAPNLSGIAVADQARAMDLTERVWWFAEEVLTPGGAMLIKVFQGPGIDEFVKMMRQHFTKVVMRKPKASRAKSREFYLLALGKR